MQAFDLLSTVQAGGYISPWKAIPALLVLLVWARLLAWVDVDAQAAHLPRVPFNLGNLAGMIVAFGLFFTLPTFIVSFLALLIIGVVEASVYLAMRHKKVGLKDLDKQFKEWVQSLKGKKKEVVTEGKVTIYGQDSRPLPTPESDSPDRPAYDAIQQALTGPLTQEAQSIDIAPEGETVAIKYVVDNFTHNGGTLERGIGQSAIAYAKWAAGMNVEDRRKPQTGTLKVLFEKNKHELKLQTAGTTAGEYLRALIDPKTRYTYKLPELGLSDGQFERLNGLIKEDKGGLIILSAPKGHGLTSLFYTIMRSHDLFLEHAQTIERDQEQDIEGITQNKLPPNPAPGEEFKMVDWVISQEPDVLGISKVEDPKSAKALLEFTKSGKRAYVCMRANSTFEAIEQWKRLVGNSASATESLRLVINSRVLRKLCTACKEGFTPDPATLKKLNMSPDRSVTLYKAREATMRDEKGRPVPCTFCHELRYKGRSGIFETAEVNDDLRQAIDTGKQ